MLSCEETKNMYVLYAKDANGIEMCPYCNAKANFSYVKDNFAGNERINIYINCPECGAATNPVNAEESYYILKEKRFRKLEYDEVINAVKRYWNEKRFDLKTTLLHKTIEERIVWQIKILLDNAWYGGTLPVDSIEYKTGHAIRVVVENTGLLDADSTMAYDLEEVSYKLYEDSNVKEIISNYLYAIDNVEMELDKIVFWGYNFFRKLEEGILI